MSIKIPTPKYNFGDVLCITHLVTKQECEPCPECFNGKLKVIGPKGETKEVSCRECSGRGHTYKVIRTVGRYEIVGMLEITRVRIEVSQTPDHWHGDGVTYQGNVTWFNDLDQAHRNWNVFNEKRLVRPSECQPLGEFEEVKR